MDVLLVGCGHSGREFDSRMLAQFDRIGIVNGALQQRRLKFDDYFCFDSGCWRYDWFLDTYYRASRFYTSPLVAEKLDKEGPETHVFAHGPHSLIAEPPGAKTTEISRPAPTGSRRYGMVALSGTVFHAGVHIYSWMPGVESITLLGFEHDLGPDDRYHWYDPEPVEYELIPKFRPKLVNHIAKSMQVVLNARQRCRVGFHPACQGPLRERLERLPKV